MAGGHLPVMPGACIEGLAIRSDGIYVDGTFGRGGHSARILAGLGPGGKLIAIDRDPQAVLSLQGSDGIEPVLADLESGPWPFPPQSFDGIVVTNYLHRPLFAPIIAALRSGGVLIYETFAVGNEMFGRPSNPQFLLRRGELLELAGPGLQVVAFEQGVVSRPKPAVVERICAIGAGSQWWPLERD